MNMQKEKLIMKFLKSQSKKADMQILRDELKKSVACEQASEMIGS
jgi:hypothetical protein